jgi:F0F1-type ATP synthase delta subunit
VRIEPRLDPDVIGGIGIKVQIGSTVYDGTVRGQLARLPAPNA